MSLFGNRVLAGVISYNEATVENRVGPKSDVTGVLTRRRCRDTREEGHLTVEAEVW